jgi:glycosyltransferase involved in cell wall biosynthesis
VYTRRVRVCLFTDTLGDVNGVSRFIRDIAEEAIRTGRDLRVLTSTRFEIPRRNNLINFDPVLAMPMPGYEHLELALPPLLRMLRYADRARPDAIHISTPGPVGALGLIAARRRRVPVVGVYHTDFPAYIDRLFGDDGFTALTAAYMRFFYARFATVLTRSADYAGPLARLGIAPERIVRLRPGINVQRFSTAHRDDGVWERVGVPPGGVKVIYCGRVSVEKNLPLLSRVWKRVQMQLSPREARLVVIGDGPYRKLMAKELGQGAHFLGFRHGRELSSLYASADLFVFPSRTDTLGQVVMEAQASGLPVLVTDRGGPREVVRQGETGMVLSSESPQRWAHAIVSLVRDEGRRRRMGAAAAEAMRPMSIGASFEQWWHVHESARAGAPAGREEPAPVR